MLWIAHLTVATEFSFVMAALDEIDLRLLTELQTDADRPNVEIARLIGLSPAATLNRVRRLKESGLIRSINARLDASAAGFPLRVYVMVVLGRHDDAAERRFGEVVRALPQVIAADSVAGENDMMLSIVSRNLEELQKVLQTLSGKGGAQRVVTLLRLGEIKPESPLPLL